jgi:hypothetical protein
MQNSASFGNLIASSVETVTDEAKRRSRGCVVFFVPKRSAFVHQATHSERISLTSRCAVECVEREHVFDHPMINEMAKRHGRAQWPAPTRSFFSTYGQIGIDNPNSAQGGGMLSGWAASRTDQLSDFVSQVSFGG